MLFKSKTKGDDLIIITIKLGDSQEITQDFEAPSSAGHGNQVWWYWAGDALLPATKRHPTTVSLYSC